MKSQNKEKNVLFPCYTGTTRVRAAFCRTPYLGHFRFPKNRDTQKEY